MNIAWALVFIFGWVAVIAFCLWMEGGRWK